jgi:eukaryotic-like serine/threonine-protein kinase
MTAIDTLFSRYRVIRKLGSGGMGDVYLAEDTMLNRQVALKLLPVASAQDDERVRRFKREAAAASSLNHPNILTVHEAGESQGQHFIATEFVDGRTLRQTIREDGGIAIGDALAIAGQIASALAAAHNAGIIHRDVKPENIMVRRDGYVKVLDFGIAKLTAQDPQAKDARTTAALQPQTGTGVVFGTVEYMSPEQARGLVVDARTDIWSLGCVMHEMLSAASPFARASTTDTLVAILEREPPPLNLADGPAEIGWIVNKTLRKNPMERYQTAHELAADLRLLQKTVDVASHLESVASRSPLAGETPSALAPKSGHRLRKSARFRPAVIFAGLLLSALIAGAWYRYGYTAASAAPIRTLAVLPLKSLAAGDDYLGLGIADAVIRKTSQSADLIVRPTSAVRRYVENDTDALTAARQLNAEAVLEGTVQRSNDRLRVSVNLLRAADGASLWADSFDLPLADIFAVQDTVAQQVAAHLQLKLDASQQARLAHRQNASPIAYEFYLKGLYNFDQRMSQTAAQSDVTIDLFAKSIDADPGFAPAHAALAYAYAIKAVFVEPTQTVWAERARREIDRAQGLDPLLGETALARFQLLSSRYEDFNFEEAVRVLRAAQHINPNIGYAELTYLYSHLGLADLAERAGQRALEIDPTSEFAQGQLLASYQFAGRNDEWLAAHRRFHQNAPLEPWYFLATARLDDAQRALDETAANGLFEASQVLPFKALLAAMKGDARSAEATIPALLSGHPVKDPFYHHVAYVVAQIYALAGNAPEAVAWLKEASACGFSPYPLLERDVALNSIRRSREFVAFMAERKAALERVRREFS